MHKNFYAGEVLLIDKPLEWTSFDIVNKTRITIARRFGKKLKVGHAGTLDPLATGLLIICTGKKTKSISEFSGLDKEYVAKIKFGATTPSFDKETEPDNTSFEINHITEDFLIETLKKFEGKQLQLPPKFSAKKVNGERAYINARKGKDIEIKPVEVEFKEIEVIEHDLPNYVTIRLLVSKGTYIRSFANDLGIKLDSGAYLDELRRTKIGNFDIESAITIDEFQQEVDSMDIDSQNIN